MDQVTGTTADDRGIKWQDIDSRGMKLYLNDPYLKLCPFCGGKAHITEFVGKFVAMCTNADCMVMPETFETETLQEAITVWNTRK